MNTVTKATFVLLNPFTFYVALKYVIKGTVRYFKIKNGFDFENINNACSRPLSKLVCDDITLCLGAFSNFI